MKIKKIIGFINNGIDSLTTVLIHFLFESSEKIGRKRCDM